MLHTTTVDSQRSVTLPSLRGKLTYSLTEEVRDLVALGRYRAATAPNQVGFTFLVDGETQEENLTYGELDRRARAIAGKLQSMAEPGDRVLLLFEPGLDYILSFFGTLYAGMIPVPAYPPDLMRADRTLSRLLTLAGDCKPAVILGSSQSLTWGTSLLETSFNTQSYNGRSATVLTMTDPLTAWGNLPWTPPAVDPGGTAFLQYTSGSTTAPRGVMITHRNLFYQMELLHRRWTQLYPPTGDLGVVGVSWLPLYHDLGLIGGILAPFYAGKRMVLMSPLAFIQRPIRWLQAMARYRAMATGGPNFAYDLCVAKFRPEDADGLDLCSWRIALNGAEPIQPSTLERFNETFAPYGFSPTAWLPSYGLAEGTLGVTGYEKELRGPTIAHFCRDHLDRNQVLTADANTQHVRSLVGCGQPMTETDVYIVDPKTCQSVHLDPFNSGVGEVWIRGPGVAPGYWNQPELNASSFNACIADTDETGYYRTGDFGFFHEGTLYLTGRLKEMMIFWGRNIYPQDIEQTVAGVHSAIKSHGGAAFSVERNGLEHLIVVQEVIRPGKLDLNALAQQIRQAIQAEHHVPLSGLMFLRAGTLPKTSSGKIQRGESRTKYLAEELDALACWTFDSNDGLAGQPIIPRHEGMPDQAAVENWLRQRIAQSCGVPAEQIRDDEPLSHYVLDSITLMAIARDLEQWMGRRFDPVVLFDSPTLTALSARLVDPTNEAAPASQPTTYVETMSEAELDAALSQLLQNSAPATFITEQTKEVS